MNSVRDCRLEHNTFIVSISCYLLFVCSSLCFSRIIHLVMLTIGATPQDFPKNHLPGYTRSDVTKQGYVQFWDLDMFTILSDTPTFICTESGEWNIYSQCKWIKYMEYGHNNYTSNLYWHVASHTNYTHARNSLTLDHTTSSVANTLRRNIDFLNAIT